MNSAAANRKYFDLITESYDTKPLFAKVNQQVTDELRSRLDWVGIPFNTDSASEAKPIRQLDYACGTGLMSRVFGPYVTITRGIDVSPNMVAAYNARARTANLPASKVNAMVGNLFDKQAPSNELVGPEWENFDLVTAGFAFHHFEDVVHAAKCLKERLRPGGALVITDYLEGADMKADENGDPIPGSEGSHATMHRHSHGHKHGQGHIQDHAENGFLNSDVKTMADSIMTPSFTMEAVRELFTKAGLVDVDVVKMPERVYLEFGGQRIWRVILLAKGRRPLEESEG